LFETTIRYVGGLLSAYELSDEKFPVLVTKAQVLRAVIVRELDSKITPASRKSPTRWLLAGSE
jgi:hypothetical protein